MMPLGISWHIVHKYEEWQAAVAGATIAARYVLNMCMTLHDSWILHLVGVRLTVDTVACGACL
jgi:hypothetical protein